SRVQSHAADQSVCIMICAVIIVCARSCSCVSSLSFFFFNDTATTEIYTLSLHDALPISLARSSFPTASPCNRNSTSPSASWPARSEEHTSELQSRRDLVCRLLLEKKKKKKKCVVYAHAISHYKHHTMPHQLTPRTSVRNR